jgi:hypothetical protein
MRLYSIQAPGSLRRYAGAGSANGMPNTTTQGFRRHSNPVSAIFSAIHLRRRGPIVAAALVIACCALLALQLWLTYLKLHQCLLSLQQLQASARPQAPLSDASAPGEIMGI